MRSTSSTPRRALLEGALSAAERLASADPSNATWQRDLAVSHYKLAGIHRGAGNAAEERAALLRCREVLRGMRAAGMFLDPPIARLLAELEGL